MTGTFVVVGAGPYRLAVETKQVHKIYPERNSSAELLTDWQTFKKEAGDTTGAIPLLALTEILLGRKDDMAGRRRLVVLSGEPTRGIVVTNVESGTDADRSAIRPLPPAFSGTCRSLFDHVALCGNSAVPVLTGGTLLALSTGKNHDGPL